MKRYLTCGGLKTGSLATIYIAQRGPYVKIGISRNPGKRIRSLRYDRSIAPDDADRRAPIRVIHLIPESTLRDEWDLHCHFDDWHVAGEWFRYDAAFIQALAELITERPTEVDLARTG